MTRESETPRMCMCIDLKSFYASVECADRGLDPFSTNLVVADPTRSANTICLAITPAMKALGVKNRCRIRDIPAGIEHLVAMPRMRRYMEVSAQVVSIYLRFVASTDLHVYSIDECFIEATPYLALYHTDARTLASKMMAAVREETGITATAGVGTNLFLAKLALDVLAKHAPDGIGFLDEDSFRRKMWFHRPITDVWGIGHGIAARLERMGARDLAGVCALPPSMLRREFGKNAEHLIDHAWGLEPCTIADIKTYVPQGHSLSNGQVLMRDYAPAEARTLLREMVSESALELFEKQLCCSGVGLYVGFSGEGGAAASHRLSQPTSSRRALVRELLALFDERVGAGEKIRRVNIALTGLVPEEEAQLSLFGMEDEDGGAERSVAQAASAVRERFGKNALLHGTSLRSEANARERNLQVGGHRA